MLQATNSAHLNLSLAPEHPRKYKEGSVVALIPARGGSKGVPRKNLKLLAGKPLIQYSIESALKANWINEVWVTSEDAEIQAVASDLGAQVLVRPDYLATDDVQTDDVYLHALRVLNAGRKTPIGTLVFLQPTSPIRTSQEIDSAVERHILDLRNPTIISAVKSHRFYWRIEDGASVPVRHDPMRRLGRQWLSDNHYHYVENGAIYVTDAQRFNLERNYRLRPYALFEMPDYTITEVDTPLDWIIVESILSSGILSDYTL